MTVFKVLLFTRLASMFSTMFAGSKVKRKKGLVFKILFGLLVIYTVGAVGAMFGLMFESLCVPLHETGLSWLYFSLMGVMVIAVGFVGSVFAAQSQLFEAKDNELLLSMPIPPHMILASRIFLLLVINYLYGAFIMIPAGIVYVINYPVTVIGVIFFIITAILLPFIVLSISCLFGWILAWITSKLRHKNIFTIVLSIGFLLAYLGVYSQVQTYLGILIENGETIANAIKKVIPPIFHLGNAISVGSFRSLIIFALFAIVPFAIVYFILSHNFIKIITTKRGTYKLKYKEKSLKQSSIRESLVKKELSLFFSSPMYIMNASMGMIFMIILSVMLVVKREEIMEVITIIPQVEAFLPALVTAGLSILATLNIISAPSISLEGKNLWIVKSLPIDAGEVLVSKALTHIILCMPAVIVAATTCVTFLPMSFVQGILLFLVPSIVTVFLGLFGVTVNLHFPKFNWASEVVAVKQGVSTIIAMFGSALILLISVIIYIFLLTNLLGTELYLLICFILFTLLSYGLYKYLLTKGKKIFEKL